MFGLTPQGLQIKRFEVVRQDILEHLRAEFGQDIETGSDSAFGRFAAVVATRVAEVWEVQQDCHAGQYPASAEGAQLDNVLDLNGLRRLAEDFSLAWELLAIESGATVPAESRVSHATTGEKFHTQQDEVGDLTNPNAAASFLVLNAASPGNPHGVGEVYTVVVDGVSSVYTTIGGESDLDIATALGALIDPAFAITDVDQGLRTFKVAGDQRNRLGLVGKRLRVSGAAGTPSNNGQYTIVQAVLDGGDTVVEVAQEIPSSDVSGSIRWNCASGPLVIGADTFLLLFAFDISPTPLPPGSADATDFDMTISASGSIPANFVLSVVGRITEVIADVTGPIEAGLNTLTVIENPAQGWQSTGNLIAADPGRVIEPDVDARQRRHKEVRVGLGPSTPGLLGMLLEVSGVDDAQVFPNETGVVDADGRPPHSVECVVSGGRDEDVALAIFNRVAAGIQTYGNTIEVVVDSQDVSHPIRFSRPVDVPIWVAVDVLALYDEEVLPSLAAGAIADAVVAFGASFRGGLDVFPQRLSGAIFAAVPGLGEIAVEVGLTPVTSTAPVAIAANEIARFDTSRVSVTGL